MKKLLIVLSVLVALLGGTYYWLVMESHGPDSGHYSIDMTEVRRLAGSLPGAKAQQIRVERVADFSFPKTAAVAGDGWQWIPVPVMSYQLIFPDNTIIIDTALDSDIGNAGGTVFFDKDAYERMTTAMDAAKYIIITHEHMDHIGGLTKHPRLTDILDQVRLNQEQVDHLTLAKPAEFPAGALNGYTPTRYDEYMALAPGVVLIRAPGHTPGSQMVYVQKADGTELLFLGDVAWTQRNVDVVRQRARLISQFFLKEDYNAVMLELTELHRLRQAEPNIVMIPGHDVLVYDLLTKQGLLGKRFK